MNVGNQKKLPFGDGLYHLFICNMSKWLAAFFSEISPWVRLPQLPPFCLPEFKVLREELTVHASSYPK